MERTVLVLLFVVLKGIFDRAFSLFYGLGDCADLEKRRGPPKGGPQIPSTNLTYSPIIATTIGAIRRATI